MSSNSRGDRIQLLQKVLKKHFKPVAPVEGRSVLEQILFASCLEDARYDAAEEAFQRVQEIYFDWNEVRVTTVTELAESLRGLPNPSAAALRIKRNLQAIFESRYSFDLEDLRKMNLGKAVQEFEKFSGMSRFVLGYVVQHALGGHTIPISDSINQVLLLTGVVSLSEVEKHQTPGLDRAIPKTKGIEFASCLHQLAADFLAQPQSKVTKAILKEAGATEPIKPIETKPPEVKKAPEPVAEKADPKKPDTKKAAPLKAAPLKVEAKPADAKKSDGKKAEAGKADAGKSDGKKTDTKKVESKKLESKTADAVPETRKTETKKLEAKKQDTAKPAATKPAATKPVAGKPVAGKPDAKKPELKKTESKKPELKKPESGNADKTGTKKPPSTAAAASPKPLGTPVAKKPPLKKLTKRKPK
jgi:hypothetical protein